MKNINCRSLSFKYFNIFNNKNLIELEKIISKNIILIDWTGTYKGKENFLSLYKRLFKKKINVKIISSYFLEKQKNIDISICFLLEIKISGKKIKVVDVLFFKNNKIVKILAFK